MEQYEIPPRQHFQTIKKILKHFQPTYIFIRFVGSAGGGVVFDDDLSGKKLEFQKVTGGYNILINGDQKFYWETEKMIRGKKFYHKKWAIAYERSDEVGKEHFAPGGYPIPGYPYTGPDDKRLPPVRKTMLRTANMQFYMHIRFSGKIPIKRCNENPQAQDRAWHWWMVDIK